MTRRTVKMHHRYDPDVIPLIEINDREGEIAR